MDKNNFRTGCRVCGQPLEYYSSTKRLRCAVCRQEFDAGCACIDGHYVCDKCHAPSAFDVIFDLAKNTDSKNPIAIATAMMRQRVVNMHGPEHHFLVASALLCAYKNSGGDVDLNLALEKALQRAKNVPGGICGLWGSCGAAVSTGIFISVITGATSLSQKEWSLSNLMTSRSLAVISANGGPRCCKRNTYLAIVAAIDFVQEHMGILMEKAQDIKCEFSGMNKQCKGSSCLFWHNAN